jgi:hypothetical protein
MENTIEWTSENTVRLEHVLPHETIGELLKRAHLEGGTRFRVSITIEEEEEEATPQTPERVARMAALLERLASNNVSAETVRVLEKGVREFRENFAMRDPFTGERT